MIHPSIRYPFGKMLSRTIGFVLLFYFIGSIDAIPIDNGVEGEPEIECGASTITVTFNTRNNFEGHTYVKGRFAEQGCRNDENGRKIATITLPFTACGVERRRSLNPRGIFVSTTVVVTFHPQFLTKVDRAYTLQCFYMEADKTVSQQLEVSEITTQFQSQQVPMPVCRYDILDGSPTGQPIKFALIGQQVYHKWTCVTETTDIFCMVVHDCFVDDGAGNKANLLNENGCALDKFLLQNLEYSSDLMAGKEAHVFKYADKAALFFQCQVTITIKEPGQQCQRPQCPEPGGAGGGLVGGAGATGGGKAPGPSAAGKTLSPVRPAPSPAGPGARAITLRPQSRPPPIGGGPIPSPAPPLGQQPPKASPAPFPQTPGPRGPSTAFPPIAPTAGIGIEAPARASKAPLSGGNVQTQLPPQNVPTGIGSGPNDNAGTPGGQGAPNPGGQGAPNPGGQGAPNPGGQGTPNSYATANPNIPPIALGGSAPPPSQPQVSNAPPYQVQQSVPPAPVVSNPPPQLVQPAQPYGTNAPPPPQSAPPPPPVQPQATNAAPTSAAPPPPVTSAPPVVYATGLPVTNAPGYPVPSQPPPVVLATQGLPSGGYAAGALPLPVDFEVRKKRSPLFADEVGTWDLRAQSIITFDIDDDSSLLKDLRSHQHASSGEISTTPNSLSLSESYCMTSTSLGLFLSFVVASILTAIIFAVLFYLRKSGKF